MADANGNGPRKKRRVEFDDDELFNDEFSGVMSAVPSLKSMSMVKMAVLICNGCTLKDDIFFSSLGTAHVHQEREDMIKMMETKSRTAMERLNVPKSIWDLLTKQILLVAVGMCDWGQSLKGHFDLDVRYCASMLLSSMFMSNGKIDRVEVAKEMAGDQQLDVSKRFEIACFYLLEDFIMTLWSREMTAEQRQACRRNVPHVSPAVLVVYELLETRRAVLDTAVRKAIECAVKNGSEIAVRHHWAQLDPAESERFAEEMIRKLPLGGYDYRVEESADILCILVTKLEEHRRWRCVFQSRDVVGYCRYSPFDMLLKANRIHAIKDVVSTVVKFRCKSEFRTAFTEISIAFCRPRTAYERIFRDDYHELLKDIWTLSPACLKSHAFADAEDPWQDLVQSRVDTRDTIAFLLKDATREEMLDLIFTNDCDEGLICWCFLDDCTSSADVLLQALNVSRDEIRQLLKRELVYHDPFDINRTSDFGIAAKYCLQFEDEETKAEYKRRLIGDRIEEYCSRYISHEDCWGNLDNFLSWYFSDAEEEIEQLKKVLLETSAPDICLRAYYERLPMQDCYTWFGLDPNGIRELVRRALLTLPGL